MKPIYIIFFLLSSMAGAFAQVPVCPKIVFTYDASGNRVQRKLIITNCDDQKSIDTVPSSVSIIHVSVYPNPTNDKINIDLQDHAEESENKVELYDMNGKIIYEINFHSSKIQVDVSACPAGVYLLKIIIDGKVKAFNVSKH